jgi:hypothetical protein
MSPDFLRKMLEKSDLLGFAMCRRPVDRLDGLGVRRSVSWRIACHQDVLAFRQPDTAEQALATAPVEGVKAVAL